MTLKFHETGSKLLFLTKNYKLSALLFQRWFKKKDGPFINSSVGGAAFMPIAGAICLGLKTLSSVFCEKLPSRRQRSFNILAMRKGKYKYAFSSLTVSAWNFCVRLEYFLWPRSSQLHSVSVL